MTFEIGLHLRQPELDSRPSAPLEGGKVVFQRGAQGGGLADAGLHGSVGANVIVKIRDPQVLPLSGAVGTLRTITIPRGSAGRRAGRARPLRFRRWEPSTGGNCRDHAW